MADSLRIDLLLHRLCLTRSRSEAKAACEAGAVNVDGRAARASQSVSAGQRVIVQFPGRTVEFEVLALPGKSVPKKNAREMYRVLRDDEVGPEGG